MSVSIFVNFNGNCEEAINFYSKVFDAPLNPIMRFGAGDGSFPISDEEQGYVLYTFLNILGSVVMFSDIPKNMQPAKGNNISLSISTKTEDQTKKLFDLLKEGASVSMPLQKTFWSPCYASLTDKFGICWQLSMEGANQI